VLPVVLTLMGVAPILITVKLSKTGAISNRKKESSTNTHVILCMIYETK
jgi:hypothetical protein